MTEETTRRRVLRSTAGLAAATGLVGTASAHDGEHGPVEGLTEQLPEAPYTVTAYEKSEFVPHVLPISPGGTVTFLGNRYPHTVTSTDALTDVVDGCGTGSDPYNGESTDTYDGESCGFGCQKHTVESPDEPFNVFLASGGSAEITFESPGRYPYYCVPHCGQLMMGEVIVGGAPE